MPAKKISGIKRHIAVDILGLPHAISITTANITDRQGAIAMLKKQKENLSQVINILVDGGYRGESFAGSVKTIIHSAVEVVKKMNFTNLK